mmetsp:Transcript_734/g.1542  ORF Transcript_734/g.1542 Transcript_734/m.1542 type:complete len:438 (-) Transcript_734:1273-2586(-)
MTSLVHAPLGLRLGIHVGVLHRRGRRSQSRGRWCGGLRVGVGLTLGCGDVRRRPHWPSLMHGRLLTLRKGQLQGESMVRRVVGSWFFHQCWWAPFSSRPESVAVGAPTCVCTSRLQGVRRGIRRAACRTLARRCGGSHLVGLSPPPRVSLLTVRGSRCGGGVAARHDGRSLLRLSALSCGDFLYLARQGWCWRDNTLRMTSPRSLRRWPCGSMSLAFGIQVSPLMSVRQRRLVCVGIHKNRSLALAGRVRGKSTTDVIIAIQVQLAQMELLHMHLVSSNSALVLALHSCRSRVRLRVGGVLFTRGTCFGLENTVRRFGHRRRVRFRPPRDVLVVLVDGSAILRHLPGPVRSLWLEMAVANGLLVGVLGVMVGALRRARLAGILLNTPGDHVLEPLQKCVRALVRRRAGSLRVAPITSLCPGLIGQPARRRRASLVPT